MNANSRKMNLKLISNEVYAGLKVLICNQNSDLCRLGMNKRFGRWTYVKAKLVDIVSLRYQAVEVDIQLIMRIFQPSHVEYGELFARAPRAFQMPRAVLRRIFIQSHELRVVESFYHNVHVERRIEYFIWLGETKIYF
jgi:hypothetical protein